MPKKKTRKSAAKRFRLTRTGKLVHRPQMGRHLKRKKTKSQKTRVKRLKEIKGRIKAKIKKMI